MQVQVVCAGPGLDAGGVVAGKIRGDCETLEIIAAERCNLIGSRRRVEASRQACARKAARPR
jgi:hypothetical protein